MTKVIISNDFTGGEIVVDASKPLTLKKIRNWRCRLHSDDCKSGDELGGRGTQSDPQSYNDLLKRAQRLIYSGKSKEESDHRSSVAGSVLDIEDVRARMCNNVARCYFTHHHDEALDGRRMCYFSGSIETGPFGFWVDPDGIVFADSTVGDGNLPAHSLVAQCMTAAKLFLKY